MKKFKIYYNQTMTTPMSVIVEANDEYDAKSKFEEGDIIDSTITEEGFWVEESEYEIQDIVEIKNEEGK